MKKCKNVLIVLATLLIALLLPNSLLAQANRSTNELTLSEIVQEIQLSVVWVITDLGDNLYSQGSGFIVTSDGYVITTAHVVDGGNDICIGWPAELATSTLSVCETELIAMNQELDLALLKLDDNNCQYPTIEIDHTPNNPPLIGTEVIVLGFPQGLTIGMNNITVTQGIISSFVYLEGSPIRIMEIDATVSMGSSGGPLYDLGTNRVIGVMEGMGLEKITGFNFAIPIEYIFDWAGTSPKLGIEYAVRQIYIDNRMVNLLQPNN